MNIFSKSCHTCSIFLLFYSTVGKPFHFRGCGWPQNKESTWSLDDKKWIATVINFFTMTFGEDYLAYEWDKEKWAVIISPESIPSYNYDHAVWESVLKSLSLYPVWFLRDNYPYTFPLSQVSNHSKR